MALGRRYKKQKRRASPAGLIVCLVLLLAVGILLGARVFVVKRVAVRGNSRIPSSRIVDLSGLAPGQSIFSVDEPKVMDGFEREGEVGLKQVIITWPDTVELVVDERVACAVVDYLGTAVKVDDEGVVMERLKSLPDAGMPVVTGLDVATLSTGKLINASTAGQVEAMSTVLKALIKQGVASDISELNVADLDNLYLMTRGGMMVMLGNQDVMPDKILWMQSVVAQLALEGKTTGKLDVTSAKSAIYAEN